MILHAIDDLGDADDAAQGQHSGRADAEPPVNSSLVASSARCDA
jgi:hypothetical protein